jgi:HK97 family phage portal protein
VSLLFTRKSEPATESRSLTQQILRQISATHPVSPTFVDGETAMRHDAVWSCRTRIAQDVSMMPADVVRYVNGTRQEVNPTPRIIAAPSATIPAMDWRYQVVDSWLGWGNAWGLVTATTPDQLYPTRIELVAPSAVRWQTIDGTLRFFVDNVEHSLWPVGDLWHRPAYTLPGNPIGMSPIQFHRMTISTGLQAQQFGAEFFPNGHPTAILSIDDPNLTEQQATGMKARLVEMTGGGKREPLVMPGTHTYTPITVNPEDSQFIETMRYSVEQVCRIFGEDPADHGASAGGTAVTYANRSDADLARLKRRQFWVTKLQDALTDLLPRPQVVKLNTSSSLMMTARERHELHRLRLESKTKSVNEVRQDEDETPFGPEFDTPGIPESAPPHASDG